jgi:hypothetical protein
MTTTLTATGISFPTAGQELIGVATTLEATTGTDDTVAMTPLKVSQAIAALNTVLLGTLTTTSGSTQTLSGLVLTDYKFIFMTFNAVSMTAATYFRVGGASGPFSFSITVSSATINGHCNIDLQSGIGSLSTDDNAGSIGQFTAGLTGITNASTSVSVIANTGTFDAGSIRVYGVR